MRVDFESVAAPAPVEPAAAFNAHAAPTEASAFSVSNNSVSVPGEVVFQPDQAGVAPAAMPNMITAALAEAVVIAAAATLVEPALDTEIVPGVTSKGIKLPAPEKATMPPAP